MAKHRCTFEGCGKTTARPGADGWAYLSDHGPGVPDGLYCRAHAEAIEAVLPEIVEDQRRRGYDPG